MIRKIISIRNVGRFLNYGASGDVELKRYNLVFAENGRGKTTLCAILRSLQSGEAAHVLGRTTLGTGGAPEITILVDGGTSTFKAGTWNTTVPNLAIFDSTFITENIYSGDTVDLAHRRHLYRVIVGRQSVELARKIEELDTASREKSTEIREKRAVVQALVSQGLTVEEFVALQKDPAIDAKIAGKQTELEAVKQADQIKSRVALSELTLPTFPAGFAASLAKTFEGIAKDAEQRVRTQIEIHGMHGRGEPWLSEGLGYIRNTACPFCGQSLAGVALIVAYRAYFSEAYNVLRTEITALRQELDAVFADREIARMERILDQNIAAVEFWSRYCELTPPALAGTDRAGSTLRTLRQAAVALVDRKAATLLDHVGPDLSFTAAYAGFLAMQHDCATYNDAVRAANTAVAARKAAAGTGDITSIEKALARFQAVRKRHEPSGEAACQDYQLALGGKKAIEDEKAGVREELDRRTQEVIGGYEQTINRLLDDCQAGFRITGTKHGYPGGVASATYQILINETAVELGDSDAPVDRPSFKNTLSSGDRSILALAFFLAQLDHDPEAASKIVIFDDPFNSQDDFRKDWTVRKIKKCGDSCQQVIVLSHDRRFLKHVWDRLAPMAGDRKCLQFARVGVRDTKVTAWDIEQALQDRFLTDRAALAEYFRTGVGNARDVVNKVRPVLETYCKNLYPGEFAGDALGTIIGKLRNAGASHQLFPLLDDLDALNEYTRRYHHGEAPNAVTEPISDTELQGFVKKTLAITGGC